MFFYYLVGYKRLKRISNDVGDLSEQEVLPPTKDRTDVDPIDEQNRREEVLIFDKNYIAFAMYITTSYLCSTTFIIIC